MGWAFIMGRTRSQTHRGGGISLKEDRESATSRAMSVWGPGGSRDKRGAWEETDGPIYGEPWKVKRILSLRECRERRGQSGGPQHVDMARNKAGMWG